MTPTFEALNRRAAEIGHLHRANGVLSWDLQCFMPPGGEKGRAEQVGLLSRLAHEMLISDDTARMLGIVERELEGADPDSDEVRSARNLRRDFDRAAKLPAPF